MAKQNKILPESIKGVILQYGSDVVKNIRLSNILDDVASFDDIPAAKQVLRTILKAGYGEKLLGVKEDWNLKINVFTAEICQNFGFQKEIVAYLLSSIVYGLGLSDIIPEYTLGNKNDDYSAKHINKTNIISDLKGELNAQKTEYRRLLDTLLVIPAKTSAYYPASALTKLSFVEGKIKILSEALKTSDSDWCIQEREKVLQAHHKDTSSLRVKVYITVALIVTIILFGGLNGISYVLSLGKIETFNQTVQKGDSYVSSGLYDQAFASYLEAYTNYDAFNRSSYKENAFQKMEKVTDKLIEKGKSDNSYLLQAKEALNSLIQLDIPSSVRASLQEKLDGVEQDIINRVNNGRNTLILNVSANKGKLNEAGKKLLDELMKLSPDDYWLNFIKNKEL
jgi:hypothetical protein